MKYILLTQREIIDKYGEKTDVMESSYIRYFTELGYVPLTISNFTENTDVFFEKLDISAVVLTGGGSLPVEYYDKDYGYDIQKNRDLKETELIKLCLKNNIPLLGVCRGMQFINGYFGGKVSQLSGLKEERPTGKDHIVYYKDQTLIVNNYHNDGIYKHNLSSELISVYEDTVNGTVESFISEKYRVLGVQWHPEREFSDNISKEKTKNMIKKFIEGELQ